MGRRSTPSFGDAPHAVRVPLLMARFIDELKRTHHCGELRASDEGAMVVLFGWVASYRDHGGCVFVDLRDREGITQLVFDPDLSGHGDCPARRTTQRAAVRSEWVIGVRGIVKSRGANKNPKLPTGDIEVHVVELGVFNKSDTPPFEIADSIDTGEEKRLQYRYLDLRRAPLQKTLRVRHRIHQTTRRYFDEHGLPRARDAHHGQVHAGRRAQLPRPLARMNPGKFYALAESPQLFKQLYMVAGFDRYFQIVKCFRDEDLRLDRQPEFTQIDVEMSFVNQDDIFRVMEGLVFRIWKEVLGVDLHELYPSGRFPQLPFEESMGTLRQRQARPALRPAARRPHGPRRRRTAAAASRSGRPSPTSSRAASYRRGPARGDRQGASASRPSSRPSCRAPRSTSSRSSSRAWAPRASRARRSTPKATGCSRRSPR